ncbi:MAG: TerB family tellurite resistance protein [Cyanobacteria bacterium]|nr:TerB family tellurite resistance protein [Cyanobacteriota bacterium]
MSATAKVLSYVALLDGTISPAKSAIIRSTYRRAGFSAEEVSEVEITMRECQEWFVHGGSDPERIREPLREACSHVAQHSGNRTRVIFLTTALRLAASDGFVSLAEEKAIRAATEWLGLDASDIDAAWSEIAGTPGGAKAAVSSTSA